MTTQMRLHPVCAQVCRPLCQVGEDMATQEPGVRVAISSSSSFPPPPVRPLPPFFHPPPFVLLSPPSPHTHHRPLTAEFKPGGGHRPSSTLLLAPSLTYNGQSEKVLSIQGTCGAKQDERNFQSSQACTSPPFPTLPVLGLFHHLRP